MDSRFWQFLEKETDPPDHFNLEVGIVFSTSILWYTSFKFKTSIPISHPKHWTLSSINVQRKKSKKLNKSFIFKFFDVGNEFFVFRKLHVFYRTTIIGGKNENHVIIFTPDA